MQTPTEFPNFRAALYALGRTDKERAQALNMPERTFTDLKALKLPRHIRRIAKPNLLRALADDLESADINSTVTAPQP